jgi:CzcA family heavy metal efflux pump
LNPHLFRQANFIQSAIGNVSEALRDGSVLVVVVLFLFLLNLRTTAITLTAIPLSLVVTALVFKFFGLSINTMTLGGLAVAIGELVDDAVVDVENIFRRLRENRALPNPRPALEVVYAASSEVRNSIVFATAIVVLVFMPLFALGGIEGRIFAPLGIAYIVSIIASLFVSLTVTPALSALILPRSKSIMGDDRHRRDGLLVRALKRADEHYVLRYSLRYPWAFAFAAFLALSAALASLPWLGREFLPPFNEGTATISVLSPPGTSLAESDRMGILAEKILLQVPEVISTGRRTGRAEEDDHAEGVHSSEIDVDLKPSGRSREAILDDIRSRLDALPGIAYAIGQPISHRIDHLLSGVRAQIAIKLFGADLAVLRDRAAAIDSLIGTIPGIVDLSIEKQVLVPQIDIRLRRDALQRYGLQAGEVTEMVQAGLQGESVSEMLDGNRRHALVVRLNGKSRQSLEALGQLPIDLPEGGYIPLEAVADILEGEAPNQILHENTQRRIVVHMNVSGRDLGSVVREIQDSLKHKLNLPAGYYTQVGGQFESQQSAARTMGWLGLLSLFGMAGLLYLHFRDARLMGIVLLNIPFAFIGSIAAVWLTSRTLSLGSLVGFVTLCGISSRNSIMMLSHYLHLLRHEGESFGEKLFVRGALERLVPVMMTALTAGLALVPLLLAHDAPGKELLYPVAVVIFGGLISSTLIDLILTPALFRWLGRSVAEREMSAAQGAIKNQSAAFEPSDLHRPLEKP